MYIELHTLSHAGHALVMLLDSCQAAVVMLGMLYSRCWCSMVGMHLFMLTPAQALLELESETLIRIVTTSIQQALLSLAAGRRRRSGGGKML